MIWRRQFNIVWNYEGTGIRIGDPVKGKCRNRKSGYGFSSDE